MNYVIRRPDFTDWALSAFFVLATIVAAANLPAVLSIVIVANSAFVLADRFAHHRARSKAFAAIGAAQHLPLGVTAVALIIPVRERAL